MLSHVIPTSDEEAAQELRPARDHVAHIAPSSIERLGLAAGAIAGAALVGVLLGLGRRAGTVWRPINAAAHMILGARADGIWDFDPGVTPVGVAVVLVLSSIAAVIVARIASSFRRLHVVVVAAGVSLTGYLVHVHVAARTPGGLAALLTVGELRALYVVLAVSVAAGMRFAFFTPVKEDVR